jgi:hypothetical protein
MIKLTFLIPLFCFFQMHINNGNTDNSPLVTVIKFISAESFNDTLEAKKYINIEKVYGKYIDKQDSTAELVWKNKLTFATNLSKDKKFTNHFKFHDYIFKEVVKSRKAKVILSSKDINDSIKAIEYFLELRKDDNWEIVDIQYIK